MLKMKMLASVGAMTMAVAAVPALAQAVQVYTNQSLFVSQRPGITTDLFSFPAISGANSQTTIASPYTYDKVTFSATSLTGYHDGYYSNASYLVNYINNSANSGTPLFAASENISFSGRVLGLVLGAANGGFTAAYTVNGQAGTVSLPNSGTTFLGFDVGTSASTINVTFTGLTNEFDIVGFNTAVPEPATWAMLMVGVGMMGAGLRRRRSAVTTRVQFA